jgi:hypothetical protein
MEETMRRSPLILVVLLLSGCGTFNTHLLFVEESHIGLKAKGGPPTGATGSASIDFGYRRTVAAVIPKADAKTDEESKVPSVAEKLAGTLSDARYKAKDAGIKKELTRAEAMAIILAEHATLDAAEDLISAWQSAEDILSALTKNASATPPLDPLKASLTAAEKKVNEPKDKEEQCKREFTDRHEPLSVISSFNSEVTWFSGTQVHTYFATGRAATQTACDVQAINALVSLPR